MRQQRHRGRRGSVMCTCLNDPHLFGLQPERVLLEIDIISNA